MPKKRKPPSERERWCERENEESRMEQRIKERKRK